MPKNPFPKPEHETLDSGIAVVDAAKTLRPVMNPKGNNWGFFGKKNTGKTYEAMQFAQYYNKRAENPKRILVFDHTQNSSYAAITKVISLERLQYQLQTRDVVKVQSDDFDRFIEIVLHHVRNTVVVIDDSSVFFRGNINDIRMKFLKSPKNNGNEYMFQCHGLSEPAPLFLQSLDIYVLKETKDDPMALPAKLTERQRIQPLLLDIRQENKAYESTQKRATRVYDPEEDTIWFKRLDVTPASPLESYFSLPAEEYLDLLKRYKRSNP